MYALLNRPVPSSTTVPAATRGTPCTASALAGALAAAMIDEIDYPMLLVGTGLETLFVSKAARLLMEGSQGPAPLRIEAGRLHGHDPGSHAELAQGVAAATQRRLRTLARLKGPDASSTTTVAIVPLPGADGEARAMLTLSKPSLCQALTVDSYARDRSFTPGETGVLRALCDGDSPETIARNRGVALSTVRTQIGNLRAKAGAKNITALVRSVAVLPPLVTALHSPRTGLR